METIRKFYDWVGSLWTAKPTILGQEFNFGSRKVLVHIPSHLLIGTGSYFIGIIAQSSVLVWLSVSITVFISQLLWENLMEEDGKGYKGIAQNILDFIQYLIVPIIILTVK